jgi:hypothetical protein
MADKAISGLTENTAPAPDDLYVLETSGGNSRKVKVKNARPLRGALVTKAADQTAANYTTRTAIAWDSESYDTDSIHDNVTNNSRLTVPSGVSYVRLTGQVQILTITGGVFANLLMSKNGSATFLGRPAILLTTDAVATNWMNVSSPVLAVTPGDYFTLDLEIETDTSVTVSADVSWFAMEILQ